MRPQPKTYDMVIRVSRRNGRDGDSFMSPADQRAVCETWIAREGHRIGAIWDETDSVSGGSVDRVGLQAALKRAVKGQTDGIVVAKVDRFARTLVGGMTAVRELEDHGKDFIAVQDGLVGGHAEAKNPTARLLRGILFLLAEWQRDSLTDGWERVRERKIEGGVHLAIPYGYRRSNGRGSPLEPEENEAPFVREAFTRRAAGTSWPKLAAWLNEHCRTRSGSLWTPKGVRQMILSDVYLGVARSGKLTTADAHPALVAHDTWQQVQSRAERRHPQPDDGYLLSGLVRCASCGYVMVAAGGPKTPPERRMWRCTINHGKLRCPAPVNVVAEPLEAHVTDKFLATYQDLQGDGAVLRDDLVAAEQAVEHARHRHATLLDLMPDDIDGAVAENWRAKERRAAEQVAHAERSLHDARTAAVGVELPADLNHVWPALSIPERRELLRLAFPVIAVRRPVAYREPVASRARVIRNSEAPAELPGRGVAELKPIVVPDGQAGKAVA